MYVVRVRVRVRMRVRMRMRMRMRLVMGRERAVRQTRVDRPDLVSEVG